MSDQLSEKMKLILDARYQEKRRIPPRNAREWAGWYLSQQHGFPKGRKPYWPIFLNEWMRKEAEKIITEIEAREQEAEAQKEKKEVVRCPRPTKSR